MYGNPKPSEVDFFYTEKMESKFTESKKRQMDELNNQKEKNSQEQEFRNLVMNIDDLNAMRALKGLAALKLDDHPLTKKYQNIKLIPSSANVNNSGTLGSHQKNPYNDDFNFIPKKKQPNETPKKVSFSDKTMDLIPFVPLEDILLPPSLQTSSRKNNNEVEFIVDDPEPKIKHLPQYSTPVDNKHEITPSEHIKLKIQQHIDSIKEFGTLHVPK